MLGISCLVSGYHTADLHLLFSHIQKVGFLMTWFISCLHVHYVAFMMMILHDN